MINIKILVDNAISSNADAYKDSFKESLHWSDVDNGDFASAEKWACTFRHEYRAIADTLVRLFPDHEEYIRDSLTALRLQAQYENAENKEVA